jgi:hypothetical protein
MRQVHHCAPGNQLHKEIPGKQTGVEMFESWSEFAAFSLEVCVDELLD